MIRLKRTLAGMLASLVLVFSIITAHIVPVTLVTGVTALTVTQTACGPDNLEQLNTTLNKVAHALEAAVDTNGKLYEGNAYGAKGSPEAIRTRQRVATVIHTSNEYLIEALNITKGLTRATFEGSKLAVLEKLSLAAQGLQIGQATIDLVLQSVALLINQAVSLVQLFNASDVQHMRLLIPAINRHLKAFDHIRELNPVTEVFAE